MKSFYIIFFAFYLGYISECNATMSDYFCDSDEDLYLLERVLLFPLFMKPCRKAHVDNNPNIVYRASSLLTDSVYTGQQLTVQFVSDCHGFLLGTKDRLSQSITERMIQFIAYRSNYPTVFLKTIILVTESPVIALLVIVGFGLLLYKLCVGRKKPVKTDTYTKTSCTPKQAERTANTEIHTKTSGTPKQAERTANTEIHTKTSCTPTLSGMTAKADPYINTSCTPKITGRTAKTENTSCKPKTAERYAKTETSTNKSRAPVVAEGTRSRSPLSTTERPTKATLEYSPKVSEDRNRTPTFKPPRERSPSLEHFKRLKEMESTLTSSCGPGGATFIAASQTLPKTVRTPANTEHSKGRVSRETSPRKENRTPTEPKPGTSSSTSKEREVFDITSIINDLHDVSRTATRWRSVEPGRLSNTPPSQSHEARSKSIEGRRQRSPSPLAFSQPVDEKQQASDERLPSRVAWRSYDDDDDGGSSFKTPLHSPRSPARQIRTSSPINPHSPTLKEDFELSFGGGNNGNAASLDRRRVEEDAFDRLMSPDPFFTEQTEHMPDYGPMLSMLSRRTPEKDERGVSFTSDDSRYSFSFTESDLDALEVSGINKSLIRYEGPAVPELLTVWLVKKIVSKFQERVFPLRIN